MHLANIRNIAFSIFKHTYFSNIWFENEGLFFPFLMSSSEAYFESHAALQSI